MPSCWKAKSRCRAFLSWVWWMFFCGESFDLPPWKVKSCKHLHLKVSQIEKTWCFFFLTFGRICKNTACFLFCSSFWKFLSPKLEAPSPDEVGIGNPGFFWSWSWEAAIWNVQPWGQGVLNIVLTILMALLFLGNLDLDERTIFSRKWTCRVGHDFPRI